MTEKITDPIELREEDVVESQENREDLEVVRQNFAKELKKPYDGSYLKKLQRIAGAFVLAGVTVFAANTKDAMAPEFTEEYILARSGKDLEKIAMENLELF